MWRKNKPLCVLWVNKSDLFFFLCFCKWLALGKAQEGPEPSCYDATTFHLTTVSPWIFQTELKVEKCETALTVSCITTPARKVSMLNVRRSFPSKWTWAVELHTIHINVLHILYVGVYSFIYWELLFTLLQFQQWNALNRGAFKWSDTNKRSVAEYKSITAAQQSASCNKARVSSLVHPWEV